MENTARTPTGLLHSTDKLRQLIIENPELPLLVFPRRMQARKDMTGTPAEKSKPR